VGFQAGYGLQWNVMVNQSFAAKMVGLFQVDQVNVGDVMAQATLPWRHATTNYAIERREIAMNREPRRIVDLLKVRRADAMISLAEILETQLWSAPPSSTDSLNAMGIPYWIVPSTTQGFNGTNPSGFTAGAGNISSTTYPNWANYTDQYVDATKTDLMRRWRRAAVFCNFMSPVNADVPTYNTGNKYGYYTSYYVIGRLEELLEQQNDNLGKDIASMDGQCVFRRNPVVWAPKIEQLNGTVPYAGSGFPTNPIYGVNWGVFRPIFLEGEYMKEQGPMMAPTQHTSMQVFVDLTFNLECRDRRRLFVLTQ
jgi:hypothetical protein